MKAPKTLYKSLWQQLISWMVMLCLMGQSTWVFATPNTVWTPPEKTQKRLDKVINILDQIDAMLPSTKNNIESLSDYLDYDINSAIDYVHNKVSYEPYQGVLRGPDGTTAISSGNAWDQALYLHL